MAVARPNFLEWVIMEPDNWRLKKDAPEWAKKEFEKFMLSNEERK